MAMLQGGCAQGMLPLLFFAGSWQGQGHARQAHAAVLPCLPAHGVSRQHPCARWCVPVAPVELPHHLCATHVHASV
eukprot:1138702-Pelagomonas_calceolata.AAC.5